MDLFSGLFGGGGGGGTTTIPYQPLSAGASANTPRYSSNNSLNPVGTARKDVPEASTPMQMSGSSSTGGLNYLQPASVGYFEGEKFPGQVGVNSLNQEYIMDGSGVSLNPANNDQTIGIARSRQGPGGDRYLGSVRLPDYNNPRGIVNGGSPGGR